eukprot:tig00001110_g7081.t1
MLTDGCRRFRSLALVSLPRSDPSSSSSQELGLLARCPAVLLAALLRLARLRLRDHEARARPLPPLL